jgi:hypothetical protein
VILSAYLLTDLPGELALDEPDDTVKEEAGDEGHEDQLD